MVTCKVSTDRQFTNHDHQQDLYRVGDERLLFGTAEVEILELSPSGLSRSLFSIRFSFANDGYRLGNVYVRLYSMSLVSYTVGA